MLTNRSMPGPSVIPVLAAPNALTTADWLCSAFGFSIRLRIADHRVQLAAGDGALIVAQNADGPGADAVMVRVENVDDHAARAQSAGAILISPPTNFSFGERQYSVRDVDGRKWTFSQTIKDVEPAAWLAP